MNVMFIGNDTPIADVVLPENITVDDCILVRTTEHFPTDRKIQTPDNAFAYSFDSSSIIGQEIHDILVEKYSSLDYNTQMEKVREEMTKYEVFFEVCRQTIHFTINGLVSSHSYGAFDNRNFIILDPLKHHISDKSLVNMRPEDTYFNDDLYLSKDAVIMMPKELFEKLQQKPEIIQQLQQYNIASFEGDEKHAVDVLISRLGYKSFDISNHGYRYYYGETEIDAISRKRMTDFVYSFASEHNISSDPHFGSELMVEDSNRRYEKGFEVDYKHLCYLVDNCTLLDEIKEKIKLTTSFDIHELKYRRLEEEKQRLVLELINNLGLERIEELTKIFNNQCIEEINLRKQNNIK